MTRSKEFHEELLRGVREAFKGLNEFLEVQGSIVEVSEVRHDVVYNAVAMRDALVEYHDLLRAEGPT